MRVCMVELEVHCTSASKWLYQYHSYISSLVHDPRSSIPVLTILEYFAIPSVHPRESYSGLRTHNFSHHHKLFEIALDQKAVSYTVFRHPPSNLPTHCHDTTVIQPPYTRAFSRGGSRSASTSRLLILYGRHHTLRYMHQSP